MPEAAQMPCHHPAWPRKCSKCKRPADGFNVVIPLGTRLDPKTGEWRRYAWGLGGTACIRCRIVILPLALDEAPSWIDQNRIGELIYSAVWFQGIQKIVWLSEKKYNKRCCLPPEPGSKPAEGEDDAGRSKGSGGDGA